MVVEILKSAPFGLLIVAIWTLFWYTAWVDEPCCQTINGTRSYQR
jgi:hypothetical protein